MDTTAESDLYSVATAALGQPVRAAGQFHSVADANPRSLEGKSISEWVFLKTRARLPAYPYVAVMAGELVMLEFRFSSTIRVRRVVGRWPLTAVKVLSADPAHRQMTLSLPDRRFPAVLEGVYGTPRETDVVTALQAACQGHG